MAEESPEQSMPASEEANAVPAPIDEAAPTEPVVQPQQPPAAVPSATTPEPNAGRASLDQQVAAASEMTPQELEQLRAQEVAFRWQASEYVHHRKGIGWYAGLIGGTLVLVGITAWLHYWTTMVAFLVMGAAALVYAQKPPRTLAYELTPQGITIDGKEHLFAEFRSFGVLPDAEWHTIDLDPVKRFVPRITILFDDADFESIVGHLELHLPRVDRKPDLVDRLSQYLRF